jgi:hypothetical protein
MPPCCNVHGWHEKEHASIPRVPSGGRCMVRTRPLVWPFNSKCSWCCLDLSYVRAFYIRDTQSSDIATEHSCCLSSHCALGALQQSTMVGGRARKQEWGLLSEHIQSAATSIRPFFPASVSSETLAAAVRAGAYLQTTGQGYQWVCLCKKSATQQCLGTMFISEPQREGEFDSRPIVRHWRKYHASLVRLHSAMRVCYQAL